MTQMKEYPIEALATVIGHALIIHRETSDQYGKSEAYAIAINEETATWMESFEHKVRTFSQVAPVFKLPPNGMDTTEATMRLEIANLRIMVERAKWLIENPRQGEPDPTGLWTAMRNTFYEFCRSQGI